MHGELAVDFTFGVMIRPTFDQSCGLWEQDGSLRDVYVGGATTTDWKLFCSLATNYGHRYSRNGTLEPTPDIGEIFSDRTGTHLLAIAIGRVTVNCHFFVRGEIELDIDPREVQNATDHNEVLQFLEKLAGITLKTIFITAENSPNIPYLSYNPLSQSWAIHESRLGKK